MSNTPRFDAAYAECLDDTGVITRLEPLYNLAKRLEFEVRQSACDSDLPRNTCKKCGDYIVEGFASAGECHRCMAQGIFPPSPLLFCPHCGETYVSLLKPGGGCMVMCRGCGARSAVGSEEEAVAAWNRRIGNPITFCFCPRCGEQMKPEHDASCDYEKDCDKFNRTGNSPTHGQS